MQEEVAYGVREDTFLADMPIESRERTEIWRTQNLKEEKGMKMIYAALNHKKLPD